MRLVFLTTAITEDLHIGHGEKSLCKFSVFSEVQFRFVDEPAKEIKPDIHCLMR